MSKKTNANELYAIHLDGKLLKMYYKLGTARSAVRYLTAAQQNNCEIVRYIPGEVVERTADTMEGYRKRKEAKAAKRRSLQRKYERERLEYLKREVEVLSQKVNNGSQENV